MIMHIAKLRRSRFQELLALMSRATSSPAAIMRRAHGVIGKEKSSCWRIEVEAEH